MGFRSHVGNPGYPWDCPGKKRSGPVSGFRRVLGAEGMELKMGS